MSQHDDGVGYRRPPKRNQFQKGQSGNPRGRPKGKHTVADTLNRALSRTVTANENGRPVTLTTLELMLRGLVLKAVKGDLQAAKLVIELSAKCDLLLQPAHGQDNTPQSSLPTSEEDEAVLEAYETRIRQGGHDE